MRFRRETDDTYDFYWDIFPLLSNFTISLLALSLGRASCNDMEEIPRFLLKTIWNLGKVLNDYMILDKIFKDVATCSCKISFKILED